MALIKCPECNKEISDSVDTCIHCGYVLKKAQIEQNKSNDENISSNIEVIDSNSFNEQGIVTIHGYKEWYIYSPKVKIYDNNVLLYEIQKNEIWKHKFEKNTILTFKTVGKTAQIEINANENKEIFLYLDRFTGSLIATSSSNDFSQSKSIVKYTSDEYKQIVSNKSSSKKIKHPIILTCVILYLVFLAYWCFGPVTEDKVCSSIQSTIKERMKDPSSLDFRSCQVYKKNNNEWYLSGSIAGKNSYGGISVQTFNAKATIDGNNFELNYVNVSAP